MDNALIPSRETTFEAKIMFVLREAAYLESKKKFLYVFKVE